MSKQTINNIEQAIKEHIQDVYKNQESMVLTDWFVSFGAVIADEEYGHKVSYATSDTSIQGSFGIATLGLKIFEYDFMSGTDDDN